jgi:hypothetical protein
MKAKRFFSVSFDSRNDPAIRYLRRACGGIKAYGQWIGLLAMLYDEPPAEIDGHPISYIDLTDDTAAMVVCDELDFDDLDDLKRFASVCVDKSMLSRRAFEEHGWLMSEGVNGQLDYLRKCSNGGKKSAAKRWG